MRLRYAVLSVLLGGCAVNAPTPSSQIAASRGSGVDYAQYDCPRLRTELESLIRRELALIGAQERRIRSSGAQETLLGVGQGDGAEAAELATVRGDQQAVQKVRQERKCDL